MAKQTINVGTTANPTGDSLKNAFTKVNANFTELYNALGLGDGYVNVGAFEFSGSVDSVATISTTDSSSIVIDQRTTISSDLTVGGDLLPSTNLGGNLGSSTQQWRGLYVSNNTIYLNNIPLSLDGSNNLTVNGTPISQAITYAQIPGAPFDIADLTDDTGLLGGGITASSSDTFTNKTINIQSGQGNTFQIQGNSISSYSGSGSIIALTTMPTLYGLNLNNSSLTVDGGTGSYFWKPTAFDGTGTIHKAGVYKSNLDANNALFTFGANSTGTMSVAVEGSLFVGNGVPSNSGGLNTNYGGWLVVQSGGKFGGDIDTLGRLGFSNDATGYIAFGSGKIFKVVSAPTHSYGASGDLLGHVAFDSNYFYYCKANYVDNSTNVWVRVAWDGTTW